MIDYIAIYGRVLMEAPERLPWDQYGVLQALASASRSTCTRARNGAVLMKDKRVIVQGYNGPRAGQVHCNHTDGNPCDVSIHAESNAVYFAAKEGIATADTTCFCTTSPCKVCANALVQAGVTEVKFLKLYRDQTGIDILKESGVHVEQIEVWRPTHYAGYEVSNLGRVRSWWKRGASEINNEPVIKEPHDNGHGYLSVTMRDNQHEYIHALVLTSFVCSRPKGQEVLHTDDDPSNNTLENLRWGSHLENEQDKKSKNRHLYGDRHNLSKLTEPEVKEIRRLASLGKSNKDLSEQFKMSRAQITRIVKKQCWAHI